MKQELKNKLEFTMSFFSNSEHKRKCVRLARALALQDNEKIKAKIWKLFIAA